MVQDHWPVGSEPQFVTTLCYSWTQSHGGDSAVDRGWRRCPNHAMVAVPGVCCKPGWDRSVLNVTFLRRYSAAPVWDECRASLLLDPQRRRPLLMWQGHSRHPWLCPCRDRRVGRLFGSIVRGALNIRIRWRPPSAHQAAAAAGRAIGAPHRYHRSAPSQCSTA